MAIGKILAREARFIYGLGGRFATSAKNEVSTLYRWARAARKIPIVGLWELSGATNNLSAFLKGLLDRNPNVSFHLVSTLRNEFKDEKSLLSFCFARIRKTEGKRYNLTASEMRAFARVVFRGKESVVTMDYYKIVEESLVLICKFIDYRLEEPSAYDVLSKEDFISIARKIANSCKVFIDFMTSLHEIEEVDSNKVKEMLVTSRNNVIASANRRWIHFDREDIKTICDIFSNPV